MTMGDAIRQVYEALGEPSDLDPSKTGTTKLREALNDAQDAVAMWIDDRGRKVNFRGLDDFVDVTVPVITGVLDAQTSTRFVTLPVTVAETPERFGGWVFRAGGETRNVLSSTVAGGVNVLKLQSPLSSDASGKDFTLAKREFLFTGEYDAIDTDLRVMEIVKVYDAANDVELEEANGEEMLKSAAMGDPGSWRHSRGGVLLDSAPEAEMDLQLKVVRLPVRCGSSDESFELPDTACQAIVLRGIWWGFRYMQDFNAAYATKRDFQELMTRLATVSWLNDEPDMFRVRSR